MRRPRLALSLFNPRRRLRDRLLATMLVVALVPAAAFFVLTAVSLHGITQTTVNGADTELVHNQESGVPARARRHRHHGAIEDKLQALRQSVAGLAGQLSAQSGSTSPSPSPSATTSPSTSATPSPPASAATGTASAPAGAAQAQSLGDGVDAITFPDSSTAAELLVGVPAGSTEPVLTRAARLADLSKFATVSWSRPPRRRGPSSTRYG